MRSSPFLCIAIALIAALFAATSGAEAGRLPWLQLFQPEAALSPLLPATKKCIVIGGHKFCKDFGHKDEDNKTPPADTKTAPAAEPKCPKPNMIEVEGGCRCKPGYEFGGGEGCQKKCAYGMIGVPPDCRCPLGAKLEQTGKFTKGCVCEDGSKPEEVEGNYACQNLGPQ